MLRSVTSFSIRRPMLVVIMWLALVGTGFTVGIGVFERLVGDVGTVPGSGSDRAQVLAEGAAPEPETITAVLTVPAGTAVDTAAVDTAAAEVRQMAGVAEVSQPLASGTGQAVLVRVAFTPGIDAEAAAAPVAERLRQLSPGTVAVAGDPLTSDEFEAQAQSDVLRAEMLSMPVLLVLLLLVFGGLLAAGLPLLIAVVGVGGAFGILYAFSLASDVSVYAIQIVTMFAVGLAVDYALLIVYRFREERSTNPAVRGAVARTGATAGRTVLFSGLTVAVAMAGLTVFPDPFLRSMGFAGVAVVLMDMAAALTLLPALLTLTGHRITPRAPRPAGTGFFARVARSVQRRPLITAIVAAGAMAVIAAPIVDLRLSQGDARLLPPSTQTRALYDAIANHFPELNKPNPVTVVASAPAGSVELNAFRDRLAAVDGVTAVTGGTAGSTAGGTAGGEDGPAAPVTVLRVEAGDADAAVTAIRSLRAPFEVAVGGDAATLIDYRAMLAERLPWAAGIVALGTLILLFLFTGSVLLPVKAVLTNLLSIGAALGAVVFVFQDSVGGTHLTVPVLVGAIAFGLSVDYEVFLLSRMREEWLAGKDPNTAVADGLQHTGRIVTSAALLLVVVFAGFIAGGFVPIRAIGLGLVLAVALDATVVRMVLVPATMTLLRQYNWWAPRPLRRLHARLALAH